MSTATIEQIPPKLKTRAPGDQPRNPFTGRWVPLEKRRGFSAIPHSFGMPPEALAIYRVGISWKPQVFPTRRENPKLWATLEPAAIRFEGKPVHILSASLRHIAEDTQLHRDTCRDVLALLCEWGFATLIRRAKKGSRGTAVYVFHTDQAVVDREDDAWDDVNQDVLERRQAARNVRAVGQSSATPNVLQPGQSMSYGSGQSGQKNVLQDRYYLSDPIGVLNEVPEDASSSSSVVPEPSAGKQPPALLKNGGKA